MATHLPEVEEKILDIVKNEYKSITQIYKETEYSRNVIQVHTKKLFKSGYLLRKLNKEAERRGTKGFVFKKKQNIINNL